MKNINKVISDGISKLYINNVPVYISLEENKDVKVVLYEPESPRSSVMFMKGSRTPIQQIETIREMIMEEFARPHTVVDFNW